jgi:hypothetical protein
MVRMARATSSAPIGGLAQGVAQLDGRLFYAVLEGGETGWVVVLRYQT